MSLRIRILVLVLVASLLPVLAMLWLLFDYRTATLAQARERLTIKTDGLAIELGDRISGTGQLLFGLARVPLLQSGNRASCSKFLAEVLHEHPQYTGIIAFDPAGNMVCDSQLTGRQLNVADRAYFKRASKASEQDPSLIVEPSVGRISGKPVLQVAYPVRDAEGKLKIVLLGSLNMANYGQQVAALLPYARGNFQIWSPDGKVVLDNPGQGAKMLLASSEQSGFMLSEALRANTLLGSGEDARIWAKASVRRDKETILMLALSVPVADLQFDTEQQFRRALIGLLGLALVTVLAATVIGEYSIRKQASRLIRAVSSMDSGNYAVHIGSPYPRGELGEVMQGIDRLAVSLNRQRNEIQANTEALQLQARVDPLTGLANRHWLVERLNQLIEDAGRSKRLVGVIMLDLDRFKMVNDSLGHNQGDKLLVEIARCLQSCVRDGDTVARLGGDEFVVVLADLAAVDDIVPLGHQILDTLSRPIQTEEQRFTISCSLGIALYPQDSLSTGELLQHADTAMYRAKAQGGNALAFFSQDMRQALLARMQTEAGLRRALDAQEFRLYYQPIIDALTGRVVSVEALIRWQDPERGLIMPMEFIPIAEETGLIIPIGNWVMREAMKQTRRWQDMGLDLSIAINLSVRQFNTSSLDITVASLLAETGCPPHRVQFEITESLIMDQVEHTLATMHRLTALGVQLMIDDFGTGYSSLSQLKRFPVSTLKIDASFVRDIEHDPNDEALVDAIITLANKLGLRTVAEGVENEAQINYLNSVGCDRLQGYFFARPAPADALLDFLQQRGEYQPRVLTCLARNTSATPLSNTRLPGSIETGKV